jgi:hypothetical protein
LAISVTLDIYNTELAYTFGDKVRYSVIMGAENIFDDFYNNIPYSCVIGAKFRVNTPMG